MSSRFIKFVAVGGLSAALNILLRVIFNFQFSYDTSIVLSFIAALTFAFILNRYFVFQAASGGAFGQWMRFTLVNLLALIQVWAISVGLARHAFPFLNFTWHAELIAHTIGVLSPVITSYYGHKFFTFRKKALQ